MNTANISYTRNHFSELLDRVRGGETVLIMDRNRPVARLEAATHDGATEATAWKASLIRRGLLRPARHRLDLKALRALPESRPEPGGDILGALLADREDGR